MPAGAAHSNLPSGKARYHLRHWHIPDYHDFGNSVSPNPTSRPGLVTFDVRFSATGPRKHIHDRTFDFKGLFAPADVHIDFHVRDLADGPAWRSVSDGQTTVGGGMGHERNGVFFS